MRLFSSVCAVAATVCASVPAFAQTPLFSTGFEAPTYTTTAPGIGFNEGGASAFFNTGTLYVNTVQNAIPNWLTVVSDRSLANFERSVNATTITTQFANTGTQSLAVDALVAEQRVTGAGYRIGPQGFGGEAITVSADVLVTPPAGASPGLGGWGLILVDSNFTAVANFGFAFNPQFNTGVALLGNNDTDFQVVATGLQYGQWNNFQVQMNFTTRTIAAQLNGITVAQNLPFVSTTQEVAAVALGYNSFPDLPNSTETGYFDNLSIVTSAPEPGSVALLLAGGVCAVTLRRYRRG